MMLLFMAFCRYLSYIMNVATPTKDCLELTYELLLPVLKARNDRTLTRQEVIYTLKDSVEMLPDDTDYIC
jgi:hypothetical protein